MQNIGLIGVRQGGRKVILQPASRHDDGFGSGAAVPALSADRPILPSIADLLLRCREPPVGAIGLNRSRGKGLWRLVCAVPAQ